MFSEDELSHDAFLGGTLSIWQPKTGYRAATDPVFLAAACPAGAGQQVLDLGCGVGTAALCVAARTRAQITGLELQPGYAELARRNGVDTGYAFDVMLGNVTQAPPALTAKTFDHVILNPPFFGPGTSSDDAGREASLRETAPLSLWLDQALRRTKPKGTVSVIHRIEALTEILSALNSRAGEIKIKPLTPRPGRVANRVIVQARKTSKAPLVLCNPLILHNSPSHMSDGDDFSPEASAILRRGAALEF
ncbi:MAG: methyltransferase [Pseudomonadota bacterium]